MHYISMPTKQLKLVIVTGSRPQIKLLLNQAGIEEKFVDDIRITSKEALKVPCSRCLLSTVWG